MVTLEYPKSVSFTNFFGETQIETISSAKTYASLLEYFEEFPKQNIIWDWSVVNVGVYTPPYVSTPDPTQYISNPDGTTTYINPINSLVNPPSNYMTQEQLLQIPATTTPLISSGVAEKLKEAGFGSDVVDPLTKTEWSKENVNNFIETARDLGITPPSDVKPETLVITPVEETIVNKTTATPSKLNPIALVALGLGVLFLSKKV